MKPPRLTPRKIIDLIASNNKTISQAEKLSEKLTDFAFENTTEHLMQAVEELEEIADIARGENKRLFVEFKKLTK